MPYPYATKAQFENRISPILAKRLYDDKGVGRADTDAIEQLRADASSMVAGYMRGNYDLAAVEANTPHEVVRLTLDVMVAMAAMRHPEVTTLNGVALMEMVRAELKSLREAKTRLDVVGTPEAPSNVGGIVVSGDVNEPEPTERVFFNTGSF